MIRCEEVGLSRGGRRLLDGVSLHIRPGERWVLWGANGSGKTTLARVLAGLLEPDTGVVERDATLATPLPLLFQDPDAQIAAATVRDEIALGARRPGEPRLRRDDPGPAGRRVARILDDFSLAAFAERNPHGLSGGEKRRLNLAALAALESPVLILDEAELHLDPEAWRAWTRLLDARAPAAGGCLLEIGHLPERALGADGLAIMERGRLAFAGAPREVYARAKAAGLAVPRVPEWEAARDPETAREAPPLIGAGEAPLLRAAEVTVTAPGRERPLLDRLDLDIRPGEKILIEGGNGSGKTTLLLLLADLADPDAGRIERREDLTPGLAFQAPERSCFAETVRAEVAFGPRRAGLRGDALEARTASSLAAFGLAPDAFLARDPFTLSVGEQRRVALASILAMAPDLLLLDEPGAGLDAEGLQRLRRTLEAWPGALIWTDCRTPAGCAGLFHRRFRLTDGRLLAAEAI